MGWGWVVFVFNGTLISCEAAMDTTLMELRNMHTLIKACRCYWNKRVAGEVKHKDSLACSQAFAVYEGVKENKPLLSLPWCARSCKTLAKYTYNPQEKAHPTNKFDRAKTMAEQRCTEDQFGILMNDLTSDSIDSIIKVAHEEKWEKADLRTHLNVACDANFTGSMTPTFRELLCTWAMQ